MPPIYDELRFQLDEKVKDVLDVITSYLDKTGKKLSQYYKAERFNILNPYALVRVFTLAYN